MKTASDFLDEEHDYFPTGLSFPLFSAKMVVAHRTASFGDKFLLTLLFYQIAAFLWAFFSAVALPIVIRPRKPGSPRPGPGEPIAGSNLRWSQTGPPARGGTVLRTLWVSASEATLGHQAPRCPRLPGGVPILPKWGEKDGAAPWTPGFMARSRSRSLVFGDRCLWYDSGVIYFRYAKTDLGRIFRKKICSKSILRKKASKSGHVHGARNSPSTGTMRSTTQNERVGTGGLTRGRGHPRDSLRPGFL